MGGGSDLHLVPLYQHVLHTYMYVHYIVYASAVFCRRKKTLL